jgi:amino acid adenylation domain-containing protein
MSDSGLHDPFFERARRSPELPALDFGGRVLSYGELAANALAVAARLDPGRRRVGLLAPKCPELYAALLGILARGSAYVPVHPELPRARLAEIAADAQLACVLYGEGLGDLARAIAPTAQAMPLEESAAPLVAPAPSTAETPAYLLFTSGSTGRPKGIQITHGNARAFTGWMCRDFSFRQGDRFSGFADLGFDLSVLETFVCWEAGGCLVPTCGATDRAMPASYVRRARLDVWASVPSVFSAMSRLGQLRAEEVGSLRIALFIGEPLPAELVVRIRAANPRLRVFNLYGPTETTVACSWFEVTGGDLSKYAEGLPFGTGAAPNRLFLVENELYIAGPQVANGYWRNDEETRSRFVMVPGQAEVAYKTGDRATFRDGGFVFTGRSDRQVKVNGVRAELGDIEAALLAVPGVLGAAALLSRGRLAAVVEGAVSPGDISRALSERLPAALIPADIRVLPSLPLTPNGKIDRAAVEKMF